MGSTKNWKEELTVVVPCKLESQERTENLMAFVSYAKQITDNPVTVVECDVAPHAYSLLREVPRVRYMFSATDSASFWSRSLPINQGVLWATTDLVAPWDMDIVAHPAQVEESVRAVLDGRADWAIPFTKVHHVRHELYKEVQNHTFTFDVRGPNYLSTIVGGDVYGGANIFRRKVFRHVRGMSERHFGWGSEDAEMGARMHNLGFSLFRHAGPAWHLDHPRAGTATAPQPEAVKRNIRETQKVEGLSGEQLREYLGITAKIGDYIA